MGSGTAVAGRGFWERSVPDDRPVLRTEHGVVRAGELDRLVDRRADQVGGGRLVVLSGSNDLEFVVTYLACLRAGSPVVLTAADGRHTAQVVAAYDPDLVVRTSPGAPARLEWRHRHPVHDLHPDLALLLGTSGSTGSPKLVRLSHANLDANAAAISAYLDLGPSDVAVTSLPLHYSYGLSVLNSHLHAGASVVLTGLSVVDPCFRDLARSHRITNLAGVPHTFELLESAGLDLLDLPSLRFVTQAGGRMDPERVRRVAAACRRAGVDLWVMYGQTEATARMAYLPPQLARSRAGTVGVPIPGGHLAVEPLPADEAGSWPAGAGEVVYRGPNVMLGYATGPGDLARGRELEELRTGDVGRWSADGLLELLGRRSRIAKPAGLRVDLDHLEDRLRADGHEVLAVGDDRRILLATTTPSPGDVARAAAARTGIPAGWFHVEVLDRLPLGDRGKPDRSALAARLHGVDDRAVATPERVDGGADRAGGVAEVYQLVLGHDRVGGQDTFVSAGGDSLSYVEAAARLDALLGTLPEGWHLRTVDELDGLRRERSRPRRWRAVETSVVLRAVAVVLVVGNHMHLYRVPGGAHVLLAVAGFNLARFGLGDRHAHRSRWERLRPVARIAVPTSLWVLLTLLAAGDTSTGAVLLVNNYVGAPTLEDERWRYWFVEVLVQFLVLVTLLTAVPAVGRLERRRPFLFPLLLLGPALALRFAAPLVDDSPRFAFRTHHVAWILLVGWAASRARGTPQRLVVSVATVLGAAGFFGDPLRDAVLVAGILALVWVDRIRLPGPVVAPLTAVAGASLYVYLTHYEVFPPLQRLLPGPLALPATIAVGVAVAALVAAATGALRAVARIRPARIRAGSTVVPTPARAR
jgi:acyl-CoA synthetase (AMP-forming)/AMP-acid ligase II